MRFSIKLFTITFLTFFAFDLSGQTGSNDSVNYRNIGEVIVTANRISTPLKFNPGAITLVNSQVLNTMAKCISADEALRLVPGVRIDNQADGSRIHLSIRGQGILSEHGLRGIKVLVDGIPVNDPSGYAPDLYDIDWSVVKKIEVLRGPAASLYGGASNGGVINIQSLTGDGDGGSGSAIAEGGSNGFYKLHADAGGGSNGTAYRFSFSNFGGDGYRDHTAFRGTIFSNIVSWQAGKKLKLKQVLIASHYYNQNAEGLNLSQLSDPRQANPDAIPCNEYQDTKRITYGLSAVYNISGNQDITISGYFKSWNYKEPGSSAVQFRKFFTPGASVQYNLNTGEGKLKNHFSAGSDIQYQDIDEYKLPNIKDPARIEKHGQISYYVREGDSLLANQEIRQSSAALFAIDRLELGPRLNAILSVRYDDFFNRLTDKLNGPVSLSGEASFSKLSSRLGLSYFISNEASVYANAGQGFLPPSTEELASNPLSFGGFNKGIKPATSFGEEAGIRGYLFKSLYYDLTVFNLDTRNDFYRYRVATRPLETFYGNAGSSTRRGAELSMNWKLTHDLDFLLAYTFSDFRYSSPDSIKGNHLPNSPAHQLYADAVYRLGKHFTTGLAAEMQSRWFIYTDAAHASVSQAGFFLLHARVSFDFNLKKFPVSIYVQGKNLGNSRYIAFTEPDPDGNSYQPAAGREIFAGLRIGF